MREKYFFFSVCQTKATLSSCARYKKLVVSFPYVKKRRSCARVREIENLVVSFLYVIQRQPYTHARRIKKDSLLLFCMPCEGNTVLMLTAWLRLGHGLITLNLRFDQSSALTYWTVMKNELTHL